MYIKCLVENTYGGLTPKHGLCFYIETKAHKILFDLGPNDLFYKNSLKAGINIADVDIVVISHGHVDHGGGLETFLKHNAKAKIYIQSSAFEKHYAKVGFIPFYVGLDKRFSNHNQIQLIDGDFLIDDELSLFVAKGDILHSKMNDSLLNERKEKDGFEHEHSLLIKETKNVLFTGCSHKGIFNILNSIHDEVDVLIGGFHLYNPLSKKTVSNQFLADFKTELNDSDILFYTCHCTGNKAYDYLKSSNVKYISCGAELTL